MKKFNDIRHDPFRVSLIGFLAIASLRDTPGTPAFRIPVGVSAPVANLPLFQTSQVLAQTADGREAEANRLFNQGKEQYKISHFTAALQLWEQALIMLKLSKNSPNTHYNPTP